MNQTTSVAFRRLSAFDVKRRLRALQCWCGHDRDAHEHYRYGTECALCRCQRWAPLRRWWRVSRLASGGLWQVTVA